MEKISEYSFVPEISQRFPINEISARFQRDIWQHFKHSWEHRLIDKDILLINEMIYSKVHTKGKKVNQGPHAVTWD